MNKAAKFWDRIALNYSKQPIADEHAYQKKLEISRQYFAQDARVFEFGCGTGSTAIAHSPYVKHILATDISSKMIEIAQQKAEANNIKNIEFKVAAIDEVDAHKNPCDVIMGHSILHLLENETEVIKKIYTMLKKDGVFISNSMCLGDSLMFRGIAILMSLVSWTGLLPKVNVFTSETLFAVLEDAGFKIDYKWQPKSNGAIFIVAKKSK